MCKYDKPVPGIARAWPVELEVPTLTGDDNYRRVASSNHCIALVLCSMLRHYQLIDTKLHIYLSIHGAPR